MNSYWNRWSATLYLLVAFLLLALVLGALVMPASAQEATPEPVPPVVVVTSTEQTIGELGAIIIGLLMAFVAGGFTVGGGLLVFVRRLREQPELARAIERLYMSVPPETRQPVREIILGGKEGFGLAEELTDGDLNTPVSDPPQRE